MSKPKSLVPVTLNRNGVKKRLPSPMPKTRQSRSATYNCIDKKHGSYAAGRNILSPRPGGNVVKKRWRKKKRVPEHALSIRFNASLSASTERISSTLTRLLSSKLQIKLSHLTAVMAQSIQYLSNADMTKSQIKATPVLSAAFNRDLSAYKIFLNEKKGELDALWKERERCLRDIRALKQEMEETENAEAEDENNNVEMKWEQIVEDIKYVGRKWMEKFQKSEKKFTDDEQKKKQLATQVLLS